MEKKMEKDESSEGRRERRWCHGKIRRKKMKTLVGEIKEWK